MIEKMIKALNEFLEAKKKYNDEILNYRKKCGSDNFAVEICEFPDYDVQIFEGIEVLADYYHAHLSEPRDYGKTGRMYVAFEADGFRFFHLLQENEE